MYAMRPPAWVCRACEAQEPKLLSQPYSGRWRIMCQEPCDLEDSEESHPGTLWNVSASGAYVALPEATVEAGRKVRLSFCLPGELTMIQVTARVAWVNPVHEGRHSCGSRATELPPGCGLEFLDLSLMDRTRITARVQGS